MAKIYSDIQGKILRFTANVLEDSTFGANAPEGATGEPLVFDENVNKTVIDNLRNDFSNHTMLAGVLRHNGVIVTITADTQETIDYKRLLPLLNLLNTKASAQDEIDITDLNTFINRLATGASNLTAAEIKRMDRVYWIVFRATLQLLKDKLR